MLPESSLSLPRGIANISGTYHFTHRVQAHFCSSAIPKLIFGATGKNRVESSRTKFHPCEDLDKRAPFLAWIAQLRPLASLQTTQRRGRGVGGGVRPLDKSEAATQKCQATLNYDVCFQTPPNSGDKEKLVTWSILALTPDTPSKTNGGSKGFLDCARFSGKNPYIS